MIGRIVEAYKSYKSWRYRRWLKTPDGQRFVALMSFLVEHGSYTTVHGLSNKAVADWSAKQ